MFTNSPGLSTSHLEAFGRTLAGLAPFLELSNKSQSENGIGQRLATMARKGLANATDPNYYNSFVIQPFLIDVLEHMSKLSRPLIGHPKRSGPARISPRTTP